jgi:hypothetical protein
MTLYCLAKSTHLNSPLHRFVTAFYILRVLRLMSLPLSVTVRSGLRCFKRFYPTLAYSTIAGSPVLNLIRPAATFSKGEGQRKKYNEPVCKSRRLYPGCSSLFWQLITKVNSNRNNHVHRFFLHQ